MQIQNAYDILSNPSTRSVYDRSFPSIRNAWIRYDAELSRWQKRQEDEARKTEAETLAREKQRAQKAQANKRWREKKLREEQAVRDQRVAEEEQAAREEQNRAEQLASRRRQQKEYDAEVRTRLAAEHAQSQNKKAAEERLRRIQKKEAEARMREIAKSSREEAELEESKRERDEQETIKGWQAAIEQARERERARIEQNNATLQNTIAAEWRKANLRRQEAQDEDTKPNINDLRRNYDQSTEDINRRETAAAETFIQEIMKIRGESKSEVLKDAVLITLEAVDREIAVQKEGGKRKSLHHDPARLPALVTELFAKMESIGEAPEKFRFSKKRKVT